ncbi:MAG: cupin domain-containing protein [Gammaproteobacteria bacterium]|nr:cupin domain-containing protein [Gammaproteobacteria bacterium]
MSEYELHRSHRGDFHWDKVPVLAYKQEGSAPFKKVTRQILFEDASLDCQLRYFEVAAGGHTTLERHSHVHAVMVVRGSGSCLVGAQVHALNTHDLIKVPPLTWHQFRAPAEHPLGFLCMVNSARDRPQLPSSADLVSLREVALVADFIRV